MYKTERVSFSRDSGCFPPFFLLSTADITRPSNVIIKSRASVVAYLDDQNPFRRSPLPFRMIVSTSSKNRDPWKKFEAEGRNKTETPI